MDDMLKLIIETDNKAKKITDSAEQTKLSTSENLNILRAQIRKKHIMNARSTIDRIASEERCNAEIQWKKTEKFYNEKIISLEKKYSSNLDKWINLIYERVIKDPESSK